MKSLLLSLIGYSLLSPIIAVYNPDFNPNGGLVTYYFLRFNLPAGGDQEFTELTGEMVVPKYLGNHGGTYNIWPGLETGNVDGVIKNVLSTESNGGWTYLSGYCCQAMALWADTLVASEGETLLYSNIKGDRTWYTTQADLATGKSSSQAIEDLWSETTFKYALFALELYDEQWDFGPMTWNSIVIRSTGTDASWCNDKPENKADGAHYTISDLSSTVDDEGVTCYIGSLVMNFPLNVGGIDNQ